MNEFEVQEVKIELPPGACPMCGGDGRVVVDYGHDHDAADCYICKGSGYAGSDDPNILRAEIARLKAEREEMVRSATLVGYAISVKVLHDIYAAEAPSLEKDVMQELLRELNVPEHQYDLKMLAGLVAEGTAKELVELLAVMRKEAGMDRV